MKPQKGSYPSYFENYIPLVKEDNLIEALEVNWSHLSNGLKKVSPEMENFAYAPGKWTIKQVVCHIMDTERIFAYRALRFARKDPQQPLPFEENDYAAAVDLSRRSLPDLLVEFGTVRIATQALFAGFNDKELLRNGVTAGANCSVLALGFTICGHATHHLHVIQERYL